MNEQEIKETRYQIFEAIIRAAISAYEHGGMDNVRRLGLERFSEEDLRRLSELKYSELRALITAPVFPIIAVAVENQMDLMWKLFDRRQEEQREQAELIQADACYPLLQTEYGMTGEEYAQMRKRLKVETNGRPPLLSEEQETKLHALWKANSNRSSRERWLAIARAGIPLHSAWTAIKKEQAETIVTQRNKDEESDPSSKM